MIDQLYRVSTHAMNIPWHISEQHCCFRTRPICFAQQMLHHWYTSSRVLKLISRYPGGIM